MGQTPGGLPWPEPTDPLAAGAGAIRALAESVDRYWYHAERIAAYSIGGGGTDVTVGGGGGTAAWETIESNFAPTIVGPGPPTAGAAGFTIPATGAGIWFVDANTCLSGTLTAVRVTCFIVASGGKEVGTQNLETGGGNVFRTINGNGFFRLAVGETVTMRVSQNSGSSLNFGGGGAPGTRFSTRFSAVRIAP
jgi:hypothetical protein